MKGSNEMSLSILRRSLACIMAMSVKELWPGAELTSGLESENGFYCDFDFGENKVSESDLRVIEKKMNFIIKQNVKFDKKIFNISDVLNSNLEETNNYQVELLKKMHGENKSTINYYKINNFSYFGSDTHIESTTEIPKGCFMITKIAGAYWMGNDKNKMLTRIYGIAFNNKDELDEYNLNIKEAEKRDHRKLGRELDLFHFDEKVGLGLPLWHPRGAILWRLVEDYWYKEHLKGGYDLVRSPHIGNRDLWETSGHWGFYNDSMYPPIEISQTLKDRQKGNETKESEEFLLKPMNCPFHIQIYKNSPKSYRDFPFRWAECGTVYRFEKKGELSGLSRVRGFTQDDAHIICRSDQVEDELKKVVDFIINILKSFGFNTELINIYLSLRDGQNKDKYSGDDEGWDFTENMLRKVAKEKNLNFIEEKGEAAFYGPKLDFKLKDVLGREWQCSTLQFDFNLPERFNMTFTNSQGKDERPYVLHRALFGSFERFLALLIEQYAGSFPVWLSPIQVKIISVSENHIDYCKKLVDEFRLEGIRADADINQETVGKKIVKAVAEKIPYILVIGDQEITSNQFTVRDRGSQNVRLIEKSGFINEVNEKVNKLQ